MGEIAPDWGLLLSQAELRLAQAKSPSTTPPVVEAPAIKPEWESEMERALELSGYNLVVPLTSGQRIRVVKDDSVGIVDPEGFTRLSDKTFRNLVRCAVVLKGKVSRVESRDQHDAEVKSIVDKGCGFWASTKVFVEVEKSGAASVSQSPSDGVVANPGSPEQYPVLDVAPFLSVSAGMVLETVPMRSANGKVIGSLLKTNLGPLYVRKAGPTDHRLYVRADWASLGGYAIEEEVFKRYLYDPSTVIKIMQGSTLYFTTSEHIKRYAGVIRSWGIEKVVMPLSGKYWIMTDEKGAQVGVGS